MALGSQLHPVDPPCTCGAAAVRSNAFMVMLGVGVAVHVVGCEALKGRRFHTVECENPPEKPKKILLTSKDRWVAPSPPKAPRPRPQKKHTTNYKLLLQFCFHRPISLDAWKLIKAPAGWRKCPTSQGAQLKYYGVRFQCRDLKYSLTPEEVETLRAKLYLSLELTF